MAPLELPGGLVRERLRTGARDKMMIIKYSLALMSIFALFGVIPGRADDVLPPRFNFDRYSAMVKNSPFAIATAVAVPAATPNFAKDLYVANAAQSPEGDMTTIASSSDQNFKKYLTTREPVDGFSIASIEWSEKVGATKVTISKDGKFATLTFNQALLTQSPSTAPRTPGQPRQAVPQVPPMPRQARTRGVIQRNPKAMAVPTPNVQPPQADNRVGEKNLQRMPVITEQIEELKKLQGRQDIPDVTEKIEVLKKLQNGQDIPSAPPRPN
jgi:hypothetical protein